MSARQRARISSHSALLFSSATAEAVNEESVTANSDSSSCDEKPVVKQPRFQFQESSSESESECESENENFKEPEQIRQVIQNDLSQGPRPEAIRTEINEIEFLNSLISENSTDPSIAVAHDLKYVEAFQSLFSLNDLKRLDILTAVRGHMGLGEGRRGRNHAAGQVGGGANNRRLIVAGAARGNPAQAKMSNTITGKKYVFGLPSEEWKRPPSYAAGGLGMHKIHKTHSMLNVSARSCQMYAYSWSQEYAFLSAQYEYISGLQDANFVVMFLAHFPYFQRGLLDLALIYARLGRTEKALELVRRVLYVFDCASQESFKPCNTSALPVGKLCLMQQHGFPENQEFIAALIICMRLCSSLGHHIAAAEIGRYVLSLDPSDPCGILLVLDSLLLAARDYSTFARFCSIKINHQEQTKDVEKNGSSNVAEILLFCIESSLHVLLGGQDSLISTGNADFGEIGYRGGVLNHLPNWWYSLALWYYLQLQQVNALNKHGNQRVLENATVILKSETECNDILKAALLHWPHMLQPLLEQCGVDLTQFSPWMRILQHPIFDQAGNRVAGVSYLLEASKIYAEHCSSVWATESTLQWLQRCCSALVDQISLGGSDLLDQVITCQNQHIAQATRISFLQNYANFDGSIFSQTFPSFFNSVLDPSLDDPDYFLSGAIRFRNFMSPDGEYLFPVPYPYINSFKSWEGVTRGVRRSYSNRSHQDSIGDDGESGEDSSGDEEGEDDAKRCSDGEVTWIKNGVQLLNQMLQSNWNSSAGVWDAEHREVLRGAGERGRGIVACSNIDFSLPLMQLFLATLLPWIFVRPLPRT